MSEANKEAIVGSNWVAVKFGGTSVSSAKWWRQIIARAVQLNEEGCRCWIVTSALSKVTDTLGDAIQEALDQSKCESLDSSKLRWIEERHAQLASEVGLPGIPATVISLLQSLRRLLEGVRLTEEAGPRLRAKVLAFGETMSVAMGLEIFAHHGHSIKTVELADLLRSTWGPNLQEEDKFLNARINPVADLESAERLAEGFKIVLSPGFRARTPNGDLCLLGRGGSDTSAALLGALVKARRVEIWTDVHGMFSADPRQVPSARLIKSIGNREAQELASMGAKVLHPRCLTPAKHMDLPVEVRNTMDPDGGFTSIPAHSGVLEPLIYGVACLRKTTLMTLSSLDMWGASGFLSKFFAPFHEYGVSVDQVATSQSSVTVTLDHIPGGVTGEAMTRLQDALAPLGTVKVVHPCAVVSVIGHRLREGLDVLAPAFDAFHATSVLLVSASSDGVAMSFVVREEDAESVTRSLHEKLISDKADHPVFGPTWSELAAAASHS